MASIVSYSKCMVEGEVLLKSHDMLKKLRSESNIVPVYFCYFWLDSFYVLFSLLYCFIVVFFHCCIVFNVVLFHCCIFALAGLVCVVFWHHFPVAAAVGRVGYSSWFANSPAVFQDKPNIGQEAWLCHLWVSYHKKSNRCLELVRLTGFYSNCLRCLHRFFVKFTDILILVNSQIFLF